MGRKYVKASKCLLLIVALLIAALFFFQAGPIGWAQEGGNQCAACHTTPRQLIGSVRELEKERGGGSKVSTETEGEG